MKLEEGLLSPTKRYLVGVSGGRDSVALLHWLHGLGYQRLVVCHLNHGLRGRESGQDARFVTRLAAKLGCELECGKVDVARLAQEQSLSMETAAREARLEFFAAMARKHRCLRVILAHHAEDQAETVLMRVLRGTGLAGLSGMEAETAVTVGRTRLHLIRPMLHLRRAEIDAYVAQRKLAFREDSTNSDLTPTRNCLRGHLLPEINRSLGRDVSPSLLRLATIAAREDDLLHQLTLDLASRVIQPDGSLVLGPELKAAHLALQHRVLHHWLKEQKVPGLGAEVVEEAARLITQREPARINLAGGLQLRRKSGRITVATQAGR